MNNYDEKIYKLLSTGDIHNKVLIEKKLEFQKYWIKRAIIEYDSPKNQILGARCIKNAFPKLGLFYIKQFLDNHTNINLLKFIQENIE